MVAKESRAKLRYIIEKIMTSDLSGVTYVERRASIEVADDEAAIAAIL